MEPNVTKGEEFKFNWGEPDVEGLIQFLCTEKGFNEDRIKSALERFKKGKKSQNQVRIDNFFKVTSVTTTEPSAKKRKAEEEKAAAAKKAKITTQKGKKYTGKKK